MKKPKFNQLRGTPGQKARHRFCLGITLGSFVLSLGMGFIMAYFKEIPAVNVNEPPETLQEIVRKKGFTSYMQRELDKSRDVDEAQIKGA